MKFLRLASAATIIMASACANAALVERLGGLAYYDTEANLTWLADANYAQTSGYNGNGQMTWTEAKVWAAELNIAGVTDWRLPDTLESDVNCSEQNGGVAGNIGYGWSCTASEMGNLYYNVLGGTSEVWLADSHNSNYELFSNIPTGGRNGEFWTATEFSLDTSQSWIFSLNGGEQFPYYTFENTSNPVTNHAWAVHSGDVASVPVPAAAWLLVSGLVGLVGFARRRKA